MTAKKKPAENTLSFEEAIERLGKIVTQLENGDLPLEKTISYYEEGIKLVRICRNALSRAENKIKIIEEAADGSPTITQTTQHSLYQHPTNKDKPTHDDFPSGQNQKNDSDDDLKDEHFLL